jgi:hypothetical protein
MLLYTQTSVCMPCGELASSKGKLADLKYTGGFGPLPLAEHWRRVDGFSNMLVDYTCRTLGGFSSHTGGFGFSLAGGWRVFKYVGGFKQKLVWGFIQDSK